MAYFVDTAVVGAGVVGLAVARALSRQGREVLILERFGRIGSVTSARNSEVIHAGIYYPKDSLKASTCVRGKTLLYEFCTQRGLPFMNCGKLIVASSDEQVATLQSIKEKGEGNGVNDLRILEREEVKALEPQVKCCAALLSPSTGVVDSHAFMLALQGEIEDRGGAIAFNTPVVRGQVISNGDERVRLHVGGDTPTELTCNWLINAAGLAAPWVASLLEGLPRQKVPKAYYAKGNYYSLQGKSPFSRLIYPVPEQAGLGVHATVDLAQQCRFGPDVEWLSAESPNELLGEGPHYDVDPRRADSFYAEVRKYWPDLPDGALVPSYSGIRPKIVGAGETSADFVISGDRKSVV